MSQRAITSFRFQGIEARILRSADPLAKTEGAELLPALTQLPHLMRIFSRSAFDHRLDLGARHLAAAAAYYVLLEHDSHQQTGKPETDGLLDVLALSMLAAGELVELAGERAIAEHWKGSGTLNAFLTQNSLLVCRRLPPKVRERMDAYLGLSQPAADTSGRLRFPVDNESAE